MSREESTHYCARRWIDLKCDICCYMAHLHRQNYNEQITSPKTGKPILSKIPTWADDTQPSLHNKWTSNDAIFDLKCVWDISNYAFYQSYAMLSPKTNDTYTIYALTSQNVWKICKIFAVSRLLTARRPQPQIFFPNTPSNQRNTEEQKTNEKSCIDHGEYTNYVHQQRHQFRSFTELDLSDPNDTENQWNEQQKRSGMKSMIYWLISRVGNIYKAMIWYWFRSEFMGKDHRHRILLR